MKQETEGLNHSVEAYKEPNFVDFLKERIIEQENFIANMAYVTPNDKETYESAENERELWYECGKLSEQKFILDEYERRNNDV